MGNFNSKKTYFDIHKRSYLVAYILLFFLFCVGAHRFYTKNNKSALIILFLFILTIILSITILIFGNSTKLLVLSSLLVLLFITLCLWFTIDIFLTYQNVNKCNTKLATYYGLIEDENKILNS